MVEDVKIYYSELEASGVPKHHTHNLAHSTVSLMLSLVEVYPPLL